MTSISSAPSRALMLSTETAELQERALETAASILRSSGLVAFPTETVYGLGASATSPQAVSSIYKAKGRPSDNPLIVHVSSRDMMLDLLPGREASLPRPYEPLIKAFWPGALTLVFPLGGSDDQSPPRRILAPAVTAGHASVGIRMPSHPLALALIEKADLPLAAPSANLSSRPSPTTAAHVESDLGEGRGLGAILDGGSCTVGLESTVVDYVSDTSSPTGSGQLRVLRAGGVSAEEIEKCLQQAGLVDDTVLVYKRDFRSQELESRPTTPGMKYRHYAPTNARVVLVRRKLSDPQSSVPEVSADGDVLDDAAVPTLQDLIAFSTFASAQTSSGPFRVGLMLTDETLSALGARPIAEKKSSSSSSAASRIILNPSSTPVADTPFSPPSEPTQLYSFPLGSSTRPLEAGQRLFAGLRYFDALPKEMSASDSQLVDEAMTTAQDSALGVDLILVECVEETGVGLAVMERARKAAGGAIEMSFRV